MKRMVILAALACAAISNSQSGDPMIDKIINEGKNRNQSMKHLLHLTQKIGPRLTGSPNALKASEWAAEQFKKFGCKNVRLEQWGEMPVSFHRGSRQSAKMIAPYAADMVFSTPSWSPGTNGPLRGKAIMEPQTEEEFEKVKGQLKGAWVISRSRWGMRAPQAGGDNTLKAKIDAAGINGRVFGANDERVHTSGRFVGLDWNNLPTERRIGIRKSDYERITGYLVFNTSVELEFDIENKFIKGPAKMYNVIADIPGTEKPDEMVIICGHLDSWDGPGSQGANDNGTGSTVALEAARILNAVGAKPKRTIRFILWTGEEQGLLGSRAYAEKHKDEMPKVSAVLNDDGGTNYQGGYSCLASHEKMLTEAIAPVQKAFPELPMKLNVVANFPRGGSSDHASFIPYGVPGFFTQEAGKADYGFVWHTQNDRPEFSVPEYLAQSSTNHAAVGFYLANAPELLARIPAPAGGGGGTFKEMLAEMEPPMGGWRNYITSREFHIDTKPDGHDHDDDYVAYMIEAIMRGILRGFGIGN